LDESMLKHFVELGLQFNPDPFDQAVLAAVLGRADQLSRDGGAQFAFCEKDKHLQPWDKGGNSKPELLELYKARRIQVYGDFDMTFRDRPLDGPSK
ncbi:MAG TPA: hypothetical protein VGP64_03920, partial [Polyangia bacterium]